MRLPLGKIALNSFFVALVISLISVSTVSLSRYIESNRTSTIMYCKTKVVFDVEDQRVLTTTVLGDCRDAK